MQDLITPAQFNAPRIPDDADTAEADTHMNPEAAAQYELEGLNSTANAVVCGECVQSTPAVSSNLQETYI